MKVLVINWRDMKHPEAGGAEVGVDEVLKRKPDNWKVDFVSVKYKGASDTDFYNGYNVIRIPNNLMFNFTFKRFWKKHLAKNNYDLVLDVISKIPLATPKYIKDIPLMAIHYHIHAESLFKQLFFPFALYVYLMEQHNLKAYTDTPLVVDSDSTKKDLLKLAPYKDISIFHLGVELEKIKKLATQKKSKTPTLLYLGRLKKYKRVDHIIKAIAIIKKDIPNIKLQILGAGDDKPRLEKLISDLKLQDNVDMLGFVSEKEKYKLLSAAWSFVIASEKEGWGIVVIEANACGTPSIGYDVEGLRDSINDGFSGYLVDNGNIDKLADKISTVLTNDKLRVKLSKNALKWADGFSWDNTAKVFYEVANRVIKQNK